MVKVLTTFFMAMLPIVELRGAIPVGVGLGLPLWESIVLSVIGNLIPIPFILFFIKKIFAWMRTKSPKLNGFVDKMEAKAAAKSDQVQKYEFWGLFLFVAIPLPGTGAWTGALVAALLDMDWRKALPSIAMGVCGAAVIISVFTYGGFKIITG